VKTSQSWSTNNLNPLGPVKHLLSHLSLRVRQDQLKIMISTLKPNKKTRVLDVGISPNEELVDTNYFEKNYPFPEKITAVSIEDCSNLKKEYPQIKILKIKPNQKLPFKDNQFDLVVSWATLEHVGDYQDQAYFLKELSRVGQKIFVTTPYRGSPYEPHTGIPFLQWLPLPLFRKVCSLLGKEFWTTPKNLNPLWLKDVKNMLSSRINIRVYKTFGFVPSHLIISSK
jgi:hypothetical protein